MLLPHRDDRYRRVRRRFLFCELEFELEITMTLFRRMFRAVVLFRNLL